MQVENVTGVSLTSGGTTEEEGHLTVSNGLFGEIVEDDDGVLATVSEILPNGSPLLMHDVLAMAVVLASFQ